MRDIFEGIIVGIWWIFFDVENPTSIVTGMTLIITIAVIVFVFSMGIVKVHLPIVITV